MLFIAKELEGTKEKGQGAVEYGCVLVLVCLAVIAFLFILGVAIAIAIAVAVAILWAIGAIAHSIGLLSLGSLALSQILLVI